MAGFKQGERVRWNTPQGETQGHIVERRTRRFQLAKQVFRASETQPFYIVESEKSGKRAAHREEALRRA